MRLYKKIYTHTNLQTVLAQWPENKRPCVGFFNGAVPPLAGNYHLQRTKFACHWNTTRTLSHIIVMSRKTGTVWTTVIVSGKWGKRMGDVWAVHYGVDVLAWKASSPIPEFVALRQWRQEESDWGMSLATREQSFIRLENSVPGAFATFHAMKSRERKTRRKYKWTIKVENCCRQACCINLLLFLSPSEANASRPS